MNDSSLETLFSNVQIHNNMHATVIYTFPAQNCRSILYCLRTIMLNALLYVPRYEIPIHITSLSSKDSDKSANMIRHAETVK